LASREQLVQEEEEEEEAFYIKNFQPTYVINISSGYYYGI